MTVRSRRYDGSRGIRAISFDNSRIDPMRRHGAFALASYSHDAMPLTSTELLLLEQACANRDNHVASTLLNVFGVKTAADILAAIADAPVTIRAELMNQVKKAVDEQRRFRQPR